MSTKEKILDIAEEMFLTHGFEGVSVRDITKAAGTNVASVNYHFKCKRDLYREAFARKLHRTSDELITRLHHLISEAENQNNATVVRSIVRAFLDDFLSSDESEKLLMIMAHEMSENAIARDLFLEESIFPVHKELSHYLMKVNPGLSKEKVAMCISSLFAQISHFIRCKHIICHTVGREYDKAFMDTIIDHITTFSVKGIGGLGR